MRSPLLFALLLSASPSLAADGARYAMTPIEGGVIRLDTQTGLISTCKLQGADLICRSASDDRSGLEDEITRLNKENEGLKQRLAVVGQPHLQLPDDHDVDRALGMFDKFMRRFKGMVDEWRREDDVQRRT